MNTYHDGAGNVLYQCEYCGQVYRHKWIMQDHEEKCAGSREGQPIMGVTDLSGDVLCGDSIRQALERERVLVFRTRADLGAVELFEGCDECYGVRMTASAFRCWIAELGKMVADIEAEGNQ